MNRIELQTMVTHELDYRWEDFVAAHPMLAAAMDRELVLESLAASIADDPQFAASMASLESSGALQATVQKFIIQAVTIVLRL